MNDASKMKLLMTATSAFSAVLLWSCQQDESKELKAIQEELKKSNARLEEMQRNQIKEREGKAMENMKSYFK